MGKIEIKNRIASFDIDFVADSVCKLTRINIFKDTRKLEYVEARSLFYYILKNDYGTTYKFIQNYMTERGKPVHHATILHSIESYELYSRYDENLLRSRDFILNKLVELKYEKK